MTPIQQMLLGAGGQIDHLGINNLFRLDGYKGAGSSTKTLARGLDMTEGGMGFVTSLSGSSIDRFLFTTSMGAGGKQELNGNGGNGAGFYTNSFGTDGFVLKGDNSERYNQTDVRYVQRTWRNAPKFFKEFNYTGNGGSSQTITHNLECQPEFIWIKAVSAYEWTIWHSSNGDFTSSGDQWEYYHVFGANQANGRSSNERIRDVGATTFTVGNGSTINQSSVTYQVMCFAGAQNAFGPNGDKKIAYAGSYAGNGGTDGTSVSIGFRPSMVIIKRRDASGDWVIFDEIMGVTEDTHGDHRDYLGNIAKRSSGTHDPFIQFNADGFKLQTSNTKVNGSGRYIFYAVRAEDGATSSIPEINQDLFDCVTGGTGTNPNYRTNMKPDFGIVKENVKSDGTGNWQVLTRPMGSHRVRTTSNFEGDNLGTMVDWKWAEKGVSGSYDNDGEHGYNGLWNHDHNSSAVGHFWKSGPTFDYVQWYGNGASSRTLSHNLGKAPELMMGRRWHVNGGNSGWNVYMAPAGNSKYWDGLSTGSMGSGSSRWNNTTPTATHFTLGSTGDLNTSSRWHWMGLWASVDGLCKISSYYGNGTDNRTISCGFNPRFVLLKRLDGASDWCVFDTANSSTFAYYTRWSNTGARIAATQVTKVSDGFQVDNSSNSGNNFNGNNEHWFFMAQA